MTHQEMQLSCCRCSGLSVSFTLFQMAASAVTQMTSSFNCVMDGGQKGWGMCSLCRCYLADSPISLQGRVSDGILKTKCKHVKASVVSSLIIFFIWSCTSQWMKCGMWNGSFIVTHQWPNTKWFCSSTQSLSSSFGSIFWTQRSKTHKTVPRWSKLTDWANSSYSLSSLRYCPSGKSANHQELRQSRTSEGKPEIIFSIKNK